MSKYRLMSFLKSEILAVSIISANPERRKLSFIKVVLSFGIKSSIGLDEWFISPLYLTQDPVPTAPKKRGRKPKSELPEIDLGGLEDIGDIDIDDIDFDNLVI